MTVLSISRIIIKIEIYIIDNDSKPSNGEHSIANRFVVLAERKLLWINTQTMAPCI